MKYGKVLGTLLTAAAVVFAGLIPAQAAADDLITVSNGMAWTPTTEYPGQCSMGPVGYDSQGRMIGISAGHCTPNPGDPAGGSIWAVNNTAAGPIGYIDYIGLGAANQNTDYMVIVLDPTKVALSSTSPHGVRVDKLPTKAKPSTFTSAKKDGATSGVSTGFVCSTYTDRFSATNTFAAGDSGAAQTDGKGAVTGIVQKIDYTYGCPNVSVNFMYIRGLINSRGATVPGANFVPVNN
jgi:hypothetical protein